MLNNISASQLLPAELAEISNAYLDAVLSSSMADPFILRITTMLEEDTRELNQALTAVRQNQYVEGLTDADALRDDMYMAFKDYVTSYKRRRNPEQSAAYKTIWAAIEQAGTQLHLRGYDEQSGLMKALFQELDKEESQAALTAISATGLYGELKESQAAFDALYDQRIDEDLKKKYPTLAKAKRRAVPHLNALISALNVLEESDAPGTHEVTANKVNEITDSFMVRVRARQTRNKEEAVES